DVSGVVSKLYLCLCEGLCVGYGTWFFESEGGGRGKVLKEKDNNDTTEKNNKHVEHTAGKKNNTNGPFGLGSDSGFLPLVDVTGTIQVQDGSVLSSPAVDELVVAAGNTKDVNVGPTSINVIVDPNLGTSYAKLFIGESSRKSVNFRTLISPAGNATDVVVPLESIRAFSERFDNTAYGFFLGKWVTYPVVANYVKNTRGKYGLIKSMHNSSTGLFFFQFSSMDGLDSMLENGPWFIRNNSLILKKRIEIRMLSYARAIIELRADVELKDPIVVAMPKLVGERFYTCTIRVDTSATPIVEKIDKLERLIIDGKLKLVDGEGKPLEKVENSGDHESEDEVKPVDNEMISFLASKRVEYDTNSLLKQ
ncbi:zinc finger, CCHC-type containing protein, partial [Tanacetum coccineum]